MRRLASFVILSTVIATAALAALVALRRGDLAHLSPVVLGRAFVMMGLLVMGTLALIKFIRAISLKVPPEIAFAVGALVFAAFETVTTLPRFAFGALGGGPSALPFWLRAAIYTALGIFLGWSLRRARRTVRDGIG